jgi:hypothetical protein
MAKIEVSPEYDLVKIAEGAGQPDPAKRFYKEGFLTVLDVTQVALNNALSGYNHTDTEKQKIVVYIDKYRKKVGDGPATFQGITVLGDDKTRTAIAETVQFWQELDPGDAPETIDWEGPDSFHQISLSTLIGLGKAIGFQRQKSFTVKKAVLRKIEIGDITTIEQAKAAFDQGMAT